MLDCVLQCGLKQSIGGQSCAARKLENIIVGRMDIQDAQRVHKHLRYMIPAA